MFQTGKINSRESKSLVKNYQGQDLSCQGSVRSTDLHALDSNKRHIFHYGVREKGLFHHPPEKYVKIQKLEEKMQKFKCNICGYVYDPKEGDPENGVEPGTAFKDIPDDWVCPLCGAAKDDFSPI